MLESVKRRSVVKLTVELISKKPRVDVKRRSVVKLTAKVFKVYSIYLAATGGSPATHEITFTQITFL
jgi:hypothetical protein